MYYPINEFWFCVGSMLNHFKLYKLTIHRNHSSTAHWWLYVLLVVTILILWRIKLWKSKDVGLDLHVYLSYPSRTHIHIIQSSRGFDVRNTYNNIKNREVYTYYKKYIDLYLHIVLLYVGAFNFEGILYYWCSSL